MRNRQPRFPVHLPQLRRCELFIYQLTEELRELGKTANDEAAHEVGEMLDYAIALRTKMVSCARVWRPVAFSSPMQQRAQVRRAIRRRKDGA